MSKVDGKLEYPLVEWKWTEQDCIDYLNKKGLFNPLYVNFNRLGCWFCLKTITIKSLCFIQELSQTMGEMKWWDQESKKVSNHYIKGDYSLVDLEEDFKNGKIPKKTS